MAKIDYIFQNGKIFFSTESIFSIIEQVRDNLTISSEDPILKAQVESVVSRVFTQLELNVVKDATGALADYVKKSQ